MLTKEYCYLSLGTVKGFSLILFNTTSCQYPILVFILFLFFYYVDVLIFMLKLSSFINKKQEKNN